MPDKDVIRGLIRQGEGRLQGALGRVIGNPALMHKGRFNEYMGQHQEADGHFRDIARSAKIIPNNAPDCSRQDSPPL